MNKIRKFALIGLALIASSTVAMAQGRRQMDPQARAQQMTERMTKDYSLNADQQKKVSALNVEFTTNLQKLFQNSDRSTMRETMQKNRTDYNAKLKTILTEEQYAAYTKDQAQRRGNGPRGNRPPRE